MQQTYSERVTSSSRAPTDATERPYSPDWDIQLDLNSDEDLPVQKRQQTVPPSKIGIESDVNLSSIAKRSKPARPPREPSPDWDFDADEDAESSDDVDARSVDKRRGDSSGQPAQKKRRANPFSSP